MATRQLKTNYAGSFLGIWWAVVTPLLLAVSINFIFTTVFKVVIPNYYLFVLSGIIPWMFFISALGEITTSFVDSHSIIKQGIFPREFIPLSYALVYLLNFLIGFIFLLPLFIVANLRVILLMPALFLVILLQFIFIMGLGLLFSCANVFWRDLQHLLSISFMVWFWITPIFYSLDMLTFPLRWICLLNPISYYIVAYQKILFEVKLPSALNALILFCLSFIFGVLGYLLFLKNEAQLLKRI
jgi:ABC-type polysaccharide/polyol phosphate export permease